MLMIWGESNIFLMLLMLLVETMQPLGGVLERGFNRVDKTSVVTTEAVKLFNHISFVLMVGIVTKLDTWKIDYVFINIFSKDLTNFSIRNCML